MENAQVRVQAEAVWLSDTHLGTRGCRARQLLDFLRSLETSRLFLVGDILDFEAMRSTVYWPPVHGEVLHEIMRLSRQGTRLMYIPGNHDAELRLFDGTDHRLIEIRRRHVHETRSGRRLLVTHGDEFDRDLRVGSMKERLGSAAYRWLVDMDAGLNRVRHRLGYRPVRMASTIKMRINAAMDYIHRFENTAIEYVRRQGLDGIVCGHIHRPAVRQAGDVIYCNDGDWVEHCTALVENREGRLGLVSWDGQAESDLGAVELGAVA
jgi:UDP-2,3-diacylglucosamine pyrophosphatase LpxH